VKILVLQLKRIGDLVLTAPALAEVRRRFPGAEITLVVADGSAGLLPALGHLAEGRVFRRKSWNLDLWKTLLGSFDACLDFTGTDRSALLCAVSRAKRRAGFGAVADSSLRLKVYTHRIPAPVREFHTVDHALFLLEGLPEPEAPLAVCPEALRLPESAVAAAGAFLGTDPYLVVHPGTARSEKYWVAERWAEVITEIRHRHGIRCVLTGGTDPFEKAHLARIQEALREPCLDLSGRIDLLTFAAVLSGARACLSCDTAAVHLAAAFERPQLALFGVTNPFHWRPRHARALVLSAAQPDAPLREFLPRMKGAPMSGLSTESVLRATDALLADPGFSG
jgi:ADP-heptose:LPS heptosyltransferase